MFRKTAIALAALATVGAAAFSVATTTEANANNWRNHRHHHNHWRPSIRYSYPGYNSYGSCYVRRIVHTAYGPRLTWTNICY